MCRTKECVSEELKLNLLLELHYITSSTALVKYLYEVKKHKRQHVIYDGHVLGESVHYPAWKG